MTKPLKRKQPTQVAVRKGVVNVLGTKVPERELKASVRGVLAARGLTGDLILEKALTRRELGLLGNEDFQYANVYKYAFF